MKYKLLSLLTFFFILFSLNSVSAFGPYTHLNITLSALNSEDVNDSLIATTIKDNLDACFAGLEYADVGIFEYYTNFKAYAGLHNYNTVDEMLKIATSDRERAFAYCWKIHLAADGVSHNYFVPAFIKRYKINNYFGHAPLELSIDGRYIDPRANRLMEGHREFDNLVKQATGRDWSGEADKLNTIMGGGQFYDQAYTVASSTTFGKMQRGFFWAVEKFIPKETGVDYYNLAIAEDKAVLRGETSSLDPSGEAALSAADSNSAVWMYGISFAVIIIIFVIGFKYRWIGFHRGR